MTFIPKAATKQITFPILYTLRGLRETKGDVGLEIEVEGNKFPKHEYDGYEERDPEFIPKEWVYHRDGSLRGEDNAEYVLGKPLNFSQVPKAVDKLWKMFDDYGTVLTDSNRTSVHVHLNIQKWYLNRLCSFMAMYFSVEEIITAFAGEHRVGNLFCLRAKDAPGILSEMKAFFRAGGKHHFSNGMHYSGLNASSIPRFGSLEVRAMRGCMKAEEVISWVAVLQRLYEVSEEYPDPRKVIEGFSGEGAMAYFHRIFGPLANTVLEGSHMTNSEILSSLHEGIRFAQDIGYCVNWDMFEYVDPNNDPFNRTPKKAAKVSLSSLMPAPALSFNSIPATPSAITEWWGSNGSGTASEPDYDFDDI